MEGVEQTELASDLLLQQTLAFINGTVEYYDSSWFSATNLSASSGGGEKSNIFSAISLNIKLIKWLNVYYLGFIIIVGVLGNAFNFFQFLFTRNKLKSPSYYLATLSLADSVFLAILLLLWMNHFKIKIIKVTGFYKILVYLSSVSSCMSG